MPGRPREKEEGKKRRKLHLPVYIPKKKKEDEPRQKQAVQIIQ